MAHLRIENPSVPGVELNSVEPRSEAKSVTTSPIAAIWRRRGWLLLVLDVLTVFGTFMIAYYLRFHAEFLALYQVPVADVVQYVKGALLLALVLTLLVWRDGEYETGLRNISSPVWRLSRLVVNVSLAVAVLMAFSFLWRDLLLSRQVYLMTAVMSLAMMALTRTLFREIDRDLGLQGVAVHHVICVGSSQELREFSQTLQAEASTFRVLGRVLWEDSNPASDGDEVLGRVNDLRQMHRENPFHVLVLSQSAVHRHAESSTVTDIVNFCEEQRIVLYSLPGSFDVAVAAHEVGSCSGMPLFRLKDAALHPAYAAVKRVMDILISGAVILAGMPLWLALAAAVRVSGKGPVLFGQMRAGLHGKPFRMYKFRSMVADAEKRLDSLVDLDKLAEPVFKITNDPRVTRIGKLLRRTSLDEIPQMWNVLKGEMSLVGPRPEELRVVDRYNAWQRRRLKAKPGVTGYQQIINRGVPELSERIRYDLVYLKNQSLVLDLYILLKTPFVILRSSTARY